MENKGFADNQTNIETPNDIGITEKPLNPNKIMTNRVDINVLKSKLQETESKEFKKNLSNHTNSTINTGAVSRILYYLKY